MTYNTQNFESFDRAPAGGTGGGSNGLNFADIMRDYPLSRPAAPALPAGPLQSVDAAITQRPIMLASNGPVDFAGLASGASDNSTRVVLASWGRHGNNPAANPGMGAVGLITGLDVGPEFPANVLQNAIDRLDPVNRALCGDHRRAEAIQDGHGHPAAVRANGGTIHMNLNGRDTAITMTLPGADANATVMLYRVPVNGGWNLVAVNPANNQTWAFANVQYNADPTRAFTGNGLMGGYQWVRR